MPAIIDPALETTFNDQDTDYQIIRRIQITRQFYDGPNQQLTPYILFIVHFKFYSMLNIMLNIMLQGGPKFSDNNGNAFQISNLNN